MQPSATSPTTILIVDDNEANRALARHTLEDEGYRVVLAAEGVEAIAAFEREQPECVLLDVRMPGVDGFVVCEKIRSLPHGAETSIVFVTALRDVDTFDRALLAGGDDFLTKPVRPAELLVRVQTALKLRRLGASLREHYDLLRRQRDDVLRLQLQKERLMAFVVHDLKNPVNVIDLHAQMLLRQKPAIDPPPAPRSGGSGQEAEEAPADSVERAREAAAQIRGAVKQLNRMILNLLDVSKADEGKLSPKCTRVDLRRLVNDVVAELSIAAQARDVTLTSRFEADRIRADEDLLRRMLANLIENAIRHAPPKTAVAVTVSPQVGAIEIRVADAGTGVPSELRERIFDPFIQLERLEGEANRSGRGLGLTFCKLAAEAHGGAIRVEDARPGAAFVVRIPNGSE
ncbi:MAG TPA: hybrid sensor histidine kinase/response regulator [Polyangiaceae bacterium]|nr:hybrid sensor histidine kinase/response regulator [Polyangiaceae bacterium]